LQKLNATTFETCNIIAATFTNCNNSKLHLKQIETMFTNKNK